MGSPDGEKESYFMFISAKKLGSPFQNQRENKNELLNEVF